MTTTITFFQAGNLNLALNLFATTLTADAFDDATVDGSGIYDPGGSPTMVSIDVSGSFIDDGGLPSGTANTVTVDVAPTDTPLFSASGNGSLVVAPAVPGFTVEVSPTDIIIIGSNEMDTIQSQTVAMSVSGGAGNDVIRGGGQNDQLRGDNGKDNINGGGGRDVIDGGGAADILRGGGDVDNIRGGGGKDKIDGGSGDDFLFGDAGNDTLNGKTGGDLLNGGGGSDKLVGGAGNDSLFGEAGKDNILGGGGGDYIDGGTGKNKINAGKGNDIIDVSGGSNDIRMGGGRDTTNFFIDRDAEACIRDLKKSDTLRFFSFEEFEDADQREEFLDDFSQKKYFGRNADIIVANKTVIIVWGDTEIDVKGLSRNELRRLETAGNREREFFEMFDVEVEVSTFTAPD